MDQDQVSESIKLFKVICAVIGVCLGFGAPLGALFLGAIFSGQTSLSWMNREVSAHSFYYVYMTLATPLIFSAFGFYVGYFIDHAFLQKVSLENINSQLKQQSITDDASGLYNHRYVILEIDKELERAVRYQRPFSGMMIDIDDFKQFNDKYGHLVGDKILKEVATVLTESVRRIDILGRYGGGEFIIILPEANKQAAMTIAERIHKNINQYLFKVEVPHNLMMSITVSVGLASFEPVKEVDKTYFIERIDQALLKAKALGKNRIYSD